MQSTQNKGVTSLGAQISRANPNSPDAHLNDDTLDIRAELEERITEEFRKAQSDYDEFTKFDQGIRKKDTVEVVMDILNRIKKAAEEINKQNEESRERLYYLTFNSTVTIFKITHTLREAGFSKEAIHFLAFNVLCLDNNLILTTTKYLDWRIMNYCELARAYADTGAFKAATKVISYGIQKVLYLKSIEEQDPPIPEGTKETLVESLRILRTQELKYQLQSGTLNPDTWKKKIEETFAQNKYHRSLAIVECLNTNDPSSNRQVQRSAKNIQIKTQALKLSIDMIKADIELVKQALIQIHEKKKEKKEQLMNKGEIDVNIDELLEKYKTLDAEMIKEKDWKFASYNIPIEVHVEMIKLCFECKLWAEFEALLDPALVRLKFRRYEAPYLATIDVLMSSNKQANIPNGFEKLPKDLNAANLKIELKKYRATAKKEAEVGGSGAPTGNKKEDEKKKKQEEEKKAPPAKPDPKAKGKVDPKAQQQKEQEIPKDEEDDNPMQATETELEKIKHIYVSLLLQRTKNSQNAIVGIDVVMADENNGPQLPENHFAVAVPIRQHTGSYEKSKLIPYIVFRRTSNSLIDEEDCLSIITDVTVLIGQDAQLRAPLGYHKIAIDLRQTPQDLERVPNLDYVYVCYKTDRQLALTERDLLIFRRLADLEKSYVEKGSNEFKAIDEGRQFLMINYNIEMLVDLSRTIKESLLGPLGEFYLENRMDILFDSTCLLWQKYLLPVMQRIDTYVEMRHQKEYPTEFIELIDELVLQTKSNIVESFNVMHRILTRMNFVEDMIMYSKFSIYLSNLLEETGEFRNAVQTLRSAISKVVEFREERLKSSLDGKENIRTSMCITTDNKKIGELEQKMQLVYDTWEGLILRKERERERKENEALPLEEDEGDEEQLEVAQCIEELKNKELYEKQINHEDWRKIMKQKNQLLNRKFFTEQEQIIHALHTDLLVNLYRCEIKLGKEVNVIKTQTAKLLQSQGIDLSKNAPGNMTKNLSKGLSSKMNQMSNKTLAKSKNDLQNLKQTLQEAGKLPPPKPEIKSFEKIIEKENNHNPYQQALFYMCLSVSKQNIVEQKSLLIEAVEYLKKAKLIEDQMSNLALDNSIYIKAATHTHHYFGRSSDQVHPFDLMALQHYIKKSTVPARPIMITRTSTSIMLKLPFYRPITEYKSWRNIGSMSMFGKPAGSGVAVSLNNTEYEGTGEKKNPGAIINVTGLIPHEKYVFAAGGYTQDGICVNGIGETSSEILTLLPLSLHQLYGYLAEIAYKLGHYQIAKQASEMICSQFIEKNEFKYTFLDSRINPVLAFRLNYEYLQLISPIEAKQLAESFIILARVSKVVKSDIQKRSETAELKVEKQKIDMKICNYLIIALDISISINQPIMIKRLVSEIYNHMAPYFAMNLRPQLLFQVAIKCHQAVRLVSSELIDSNLRKIMGCMSYQLLKTSFENNEDDLFKRVMISELPINSRKWRKFIQYALRKPQLTEEQKAKREDQEKRIALGEKIPDNELIKDPEPYEDKLVKVEEFEKEGQSFEEFLLSLVDYQDVVKAKTDRWKLQINKFQKQASNGNEVVEKLKEGLVQLVEFWEGVKINNPQQQMTNIILAYDSGNQNPRYLEFICKCVRRAMELGLSNFAELEETLNSKVKVPEDVLALIETKLSERLEYLEKDIVRKQRKRFNILEEKVHHMQEQKTSQGQKNLNTRKIQDLMATINVSEEDDNYWGIVQFDTDEEEQVRVYQYLWVSEKLYLQGICSFLALSQTQSQKSYLSMRFNCVFNDIIQLDFNKFKQALEEHNDKLRYLKLQFEEEHKNDNDKYVLKIDERVKKITVFLKTMSRAAEYARNSRSWIQLENIIRYTWNAFSYDLSTPLDLKETEAWKYIHIIAECSLYLLEYLKGGGKLRKIGGQDIDQIKNSKPTLLKEPGKTVAFRIQTEEDGVYQQEKTLQHDQSTGTLATSKSGAANASGKSRKWFEKIPDFDINIHASFISFSSQCLMGIKKWESLVDISNRLNDVTENTFAQYLLPFIIFAQNTLYEDAAAKTQEKRNALQLRINQFENWKLTNKKKRSRQAMITGEIPVEEQEFLRDKAQLEKEIFRLEIIENVLLADKMTSDSLLENIKRDANNCEETLKQCRKLYYQFGIETQNLKLDENKKGDTHFEIKSKKKGHKVFISMVIQNYKKCIELLRKRQEKYLLIQALHELGNLLYADGQLGEAEIQWNDCVDTIFQKLYVVNSFRQVFKENPQLADSFGSKQCLIGGIVLTKLAKLCYEERDLHRYNECLLMSSDLFAAPARLSLPHPQIAVEYNQYRFREFLSEQLFAEKSILTPSELINWISVSSQSLMDADLHDKALPLLSLMEYIASDICKSKILTQKARIMKSIALIEIGYINEAYQIYNRLLSQKDLPKIGSKESEFQNKKEGKNFYFPLSQRYYNHFPPEHEKNLEAIQNLLKPLQPDVISQIKKYCSPYVLEQLQYLRSLFLVRLGESENIEMPEKAEFRLSLLKAGEESLRTVLKNIQVAEEISYIKEKLEILLLKEIDIKDLEIKDFQVKLQKACEASVITEEDQKGYYSNKEEELCYADRRSQLMSLILRTRLLIGRIHGKQGFLLNQFYVLRQGLINFKSLAEGKHGKVETGLESEDKGSFKLPDSFGQGGPPEKGGAAAKKAPEEAKKPAAAVDKKAPAGKGGAAAQQQQMDEEVQKKLEEERKRRELEEEKKEKQRVENADKRDHPHMYLWLKIKIEIIQLLFNQKRFEDCSDAIGITRLECSSVNDQFFLRQLMEIEFLMQIFYGEIESALRKGEEIRKHATKYNQNDTSYAIFLGNLSELMYNKDRRTESNDIVKEGRMIVWYKLRDYGLDLDPQNINVANTVKVNKNRPKLEEGVLAQYQTAVPQPGAKGQPAKPGQAPAKGGAGVKAGQQPVIEDLPTEQEIVDAPLDFTKKIDYNLDLADININTSYMESNIYLRYLESAVRFDVRYSQYMSLIEKKHELAKKVLTDTEKLIKRTLHISPQLKFYVNFFLGHSNLQIFYDKILEFQGKYASNPQYKESLADHIPYNSVALGKFLLELPNFSENIKKMYKDFLVWAKKSFKAALDISKNECILYEFDFNIVDALRGMAETNFLLSEYRTRAITYKYAKYKDLDIQRKIKRRIEQRREQTGAVIDDNLIEEEIEREVLQSKDEWEEMKIQKEKIEIATNKRQAIQYLEQSVAMSKSQREFLDKVHLLGTVNLTDPSKIPKEVVSELFEAYQVTKINYVKVPDFDPKDKTIVTSAEILSYLKSLVKELEFITFGEEKQRMSKLIGKLHRYLKLNLATYVQKCQPDIKDPEEIKDAAQADTLELIGKTKLVGKWFDIKNQKSSLFYIIGPIDDALCNQLYPQTQPGPDDSMTEQERAQKDYKRKDNQIIHFGKVDVDPLMLSALYQEVKDLADKMRASEKLQPGQNERDKKGYRLKFDSFIDRFGNFYKKPVMTEEEMEFDVNCLDLIQDIIPDLTVDNVEKLASFLSKDTGYSFSDVKFNTIMRRFHRLRYVI